MIQLPFSMKNKFNFHIFVFIGVYTRENKTKKCFKTSRYDTSKNQNLMNRAKHNELSPITHTFPLPSKLLTFVLR